MEKQKIKFMRVRALRTICKTDKNDAFIVLEGTPGTAVGDSVTEFPDADEGSSYRVFVTWDAVLTNPREGLSPAHLLEEFSLEVPAGEVGFLALVTEDAADPPEGRVGVKSTKKTVIELGYKEFERLVGKVYGQDWSFVADQECGNGQTISLDADGTVYDRAAVEKFAETGRGSWLAGLLLNDLVRRGELEPGDYLIDVSW